MYAGLVFAQLLTFCAYVVVTAGAGVRLATRPLPSRIGAFVCKRAATLTVLCLCLPVRDTARPPVCCPCAQLGFSSERTT